MGRSSGEDLQAGEGLQGREAGPGKGCSVGRWALQEGMGGPYVPRCVSSVSGNGQWRAPGAATRAKCPESPVTFLRAQE